LGTGVILASGHHGTLYIGITNDLRIRLDIAARSDSAREAIEELSARLEDRTHRER
jgi:hypothetical protein